MKKILLNLILLIATSSCITRIEKHGYMFDETDYEMMQEGVTDKEKVLRILGSPTIISDLDEDEAWIYYSEDVKRLLFFMPKVTERNIIVIRFNRENIISKLRKIDLSQEEKKLAFSSKHTAVESQKIGFFKSLFGNVGQVKAQ